MLSRVAAVMAPRTHDRCRVTGSRGGRREGGESEPQRPNMSRHLFCSALLLLVLVMMCCDTGGGAAEAKEQASERNYKWKDIKEGETVESLGAPGLLNVGNDVFAVAEAQCKDSQNTVFTGIASQLLTIDNADTPVEVLNGAEDKTQFLEEDGSEGLKKKLDVSQPTTVVEGSDIYMLVGKYGPTTVGLPKNDAEDCGLFLVKGEVSDQSNKRIKWKDNNAVPYASVGEQLESWTGLIGGGGSGVHTHDGRLLFPVEGTKKGDAVTDKKAVSLVI
ncbi:putative trans-sialidase, Group VI, partial [Trypanosoma cruzi]